ncbi:MAG: aldo/keto reductase [Chthoniobacterales bacterium]
MITDNPATDIRSSVTLATGAAMPMLGFGTWKMKPDGEAQTAVRIALELGYRHIDTAAAYENEDGVGEGIRDSGIPRGEIFLTTKVWNDDIRGGTEAVLKAADDSLRLLGTDYVDLLLLHWPIPTADAAAWRAMETLLADGRARAIGVCNYMPDQLESFLTRIDTPPMVNQVEFHPYLTQPELLALNRRHGIVQEAWSPIMQGTVKDVPELRAIADAHGKSPSQIVLRWDLQQGVVTIPKSSNAGRIQENTDLYDFELSSSEMEAISALNCGKRFGPDPHHFGF